MFFTLSFLRRPLRHVLLRCLSSTAVHHSDSWSYTPGNHLMRWPTPPPLQPPANSLSQLSGEPPDTLSFSYHEGEVLRGVSDESVAAISTLIRSTPLSDLNAVLLRSGFLPHSNLTSVLDFLIRSHSFDLAWSLLISQPCSSLSVFASLFRRYSRARMPSAAIRTFLFLRSHSHLLSPTSDEETDPLELLLDALCKEGCTRAASDFLRQLKSEDSNCVISICCYNILLRGWFHIRKLKKAERLWSKLRRNGVQLTAVSYGNVIQGLCCLRRPDQARDFLEEMFASGIDPDLFMCNPIVDSLSETARFREALGFIERFPIFGISPDISTYNSLIKGFCKNGNLAGASDALKKMVGRGILPTCTTYTYFFQFFAKFGKIEEAMNLYSKMIQSGYAPDSLIFQLMIKMFFEEERFDLAVRLIKEMNINGFGLDLATGTMLVHLLCHFRRYDEACVEFEEMFRRGIVPQYITYQKLSKKLKKLGLVNMEEKLSALMNSVKHTIKLRATYRGGSGEAKRKESILKKTWAMSETRKGKKEMDQLSNVKVIEERMLERANKLMRNIRSRIYAARS